MKLNTPEISWHGKRPVLSVDFCKVGATFKFASAGADNDVKIWMVSFDKEGKANVEFLANLSRHNKAVNVVRFSPNEEMLASGGDDCCIILWKLSVNQEQSVQPLKDSDDDIENRESWTANKVLRGHIEDVYDIAWSPDGSQLISGSVDNSAIIWDVAKGVKLTILQDHKHYIQGVCWDPLGQYVVTNSSDRSCRLYSPQSYKCCYNINKLSGTSTIKIPERGELKQLKIFHDESLLSFFRRPAFTPDGSLLIVPAGRIEMSNQVLNTTYVFTRGSPNKPVLYLPSPKKPTVAVRCCPILFDLKTKDKENEKDNEQDSAPLFLLPYRMVFAVASLNAVFLYDTQHKVPFGYISNIHYSGISDITWSNDGSMLVVCSTDGFCSLIHFQDGELGTPYKMTAKEVLDKPIINNQPVNTSSTPNIETPDNSGKTTKRVVLTPIQKMEVDENPKTPENEPVVKKRDTPSIAQFAVPVSQLPQNNTPSKPTNKITPRRVQLITSVQKSGEVPKSVPQNNPNNVSTVLNKINQMTTTSTSHSPQSQPIASQQARRVQLISQPTPGQQDASSSPRSEPKISQPTQPTLQNGNIPKPRRVQLISQPTTGQQGVSSSTQSQPKASQPGASAQTTLAQNVNNPKPRRVELVPQPLTSQQVASGSPQSQPIVSQPAKAILPQNGSNSKPKRVELISQQTAGQPVVSNTSQTQPLASQPSAQSTLSQNGSNPKPQRVELIPQPKQGQLLASGSPQTEPCQHSAQPSPAVDVSNSKPRREELIPQPKQGQLVASGSPQTVPRQPSAQPSPAVDVSNPKPRRVELMPQAKLQASCTSTPQIATCNETEVKLEVTQEAKPDSRDVGKAQKTRNPIPLEPVVIILD